MGLLNTNYQYHSGVGAAGSVYSLPEMTIPKSKKTTAWEESVMDSLEEIGMTQFYRNLEFRDYYDMTEGRLVHTDFMDSQDDFKALKDIGTIMKDVQLPTYVKHYDILGMIVNQLTGELPEMRDNVKITSIDEYSKNDYIRTKETLVGEYVKQSFQNNLNRLLALKGINPIKDDFESEEEQQQYLQFLEQEKAKIIPPQEIEREMSKSWKLRAVEWAENTYEADMTRFRIESMEETEMKDYLLTGRYFTHYHIGYDFYRPERWDPIQTFFSEDLNVKNPQDCEYVGQIDFLSASQIITKYGSKLSKTVQEQLNKVYDPIKGAAKSSGGKGQSLYQKPVRATMVPDEGYFDREILLQYQSAFGTPLGEATIYNEDGTTTTAPTWLSDYNNSAKSVDAQIAKKIRKDINVRGDLFRVTSAYFRGYNLYYAIRYENEEGYIVQDIVEEDLYDEFIKENKIKKLSNISLEEFMEDKDRINIICQTYLPKIYRGKKIAGSGSSKDIYFDFKEMEFQIKGDSNIYDVKIPVAGLIGTSLAQKIRPYQLGYNICLNQITNLLEKELGMFFIMDMNLLPSEFKDEGDTKEVLANLRETIRDIGLLPVDMRRGNTQEAGNTSNTFVKQEISFTEQISQRINLAEYYKRLAFEQIGITEQRKGTPNEYQTNEGIKVGQEASYAQTKNLYTEYNDSRLRKIELSLTVAQYCVENNKDISTYYRNSDGNLIYQKFSDDKFHLRKLGVLPDSSSKAKKDLATVKQIMLNNNTAGQDILDFATIAQTDNFTSLIDYGKNNRRRIDEQTIATKQHEQQLLDKQIKAAAEKEQADREWNEMSKQKDREYDLEESRLAALGRASDKNSDTEGINAINKAADTALKSQDITNRNQVENRKLDLKEKEVDGNLSLKMAQLNKDLKQLNLREKEIEAKKNIALWNKN